MKEGWRMASPFSRVTVVTVTLSRPDPLPKPFIDFRQSGAIPPDHRKYVEVQEESMRKTFPKRISPTAMQGYCGKSELSSYVW